MDDDNDFELKADQVFKLISEADNFKHMKNQFTKQEDVD